MKRYIAIIKHQLYVSMEQARYVNSAPPTGVGMSAQQYLVALEWKLPIT